jgi:RNA polymerase sigma factor (sigma-70 family)
MEIEKTKPSFDEVYKYAQKQVWYSINKKAAHLPYEQKEEISQNAMVRTWNSYQTLDPERGWRSFIQTHCKGAVLDYLKGGERDTSAELGLDRAEIASKDSEDKFLDADEIVGIMGAHPDYSASRDSEIDIDGFNPNWKLLSCMAGKDEDLHIVCKVLLGYSQDAIAEQYVAAHATILSRERISQRIYEFFKKLDSPAMLNDQWTNQLIFALGLGAQFHMENFDNGIGWELGPIDLNDVGSFKKSASSYTPSLFDMYDEAEAV